MSTTEIAPPKSRFRFSFGLGHLLTLMAGLGLGMAIMQPWKTWERPPAPVDYDIAVVSVPADTGKDSKGGDQAIFGLLQRWYGPDSIREGEDVIGNLLGTSCLSTIEGETGVMEVTIPLKAAQGKTTPDKFKVEVKPYSARGKIRTGVTADFSWSPTLSPKEHLITQASGATEIIELAQTKASSESDEAVRIFLVLTPQDATKRQFTIKPAAANANPSGKK